MVLNIINTIGPDFFLALNNDKKINFVICYESNNLFYE